MFTAHRHAHSPVAAAAFAAKRPVARWRACRKSIAVGVGSADFG